MKMSSSLLLVVASFSGLVALCAVLFARGQRLERKRFEPVAASVAQVAVVALERLRDPACQQTDVAVRGRVVATHEGVIDPVTARPVAHHRTAVYLLSARARERRLIHTIEEGTGFWLRDASGWAVVDASQAAYSVRGPRGEIETKPLRRERFALDALPRELGERLRRDVQHVPYPDLIAGYDVEQAVIESGEELTMYGRPRVGQVERLPEATESYRSGSALVAQFAGPSAKVLFSEMEHACLVDRFRELAMDMVRIERSGWIVALVAGIVACLCVAATVAAPWL